MSIPSQKALEKLLDYSALKHKIIGQNIANSETKNYKRREVDFQEMLKVGMQEIPGNSEDNKKFGVKIDEESPVIAEGNNVDVNREMADMAQNSIMFKFASKKLSSYYSTLQEVIRGGK